MKQDAPFAVQLEPAEGCTLACSFCALQTIRDNGADWRTGMHGKSSPPYKFMHVDTVRAVARGIAALGWNPRIEFAMHGEPTAHPDLAGLIAVVRAALPRAYILLTTNGSGLTKPGRIGTLFDAGLSTLAFDNYKHAPWSARVLAELINYTNDEFVALYRYPAHKAGNPHQRAPGLRVVIMQDISQNTDGTHQLTNQGGLVGAEESSEQRCAKPFRELSIRHDGTVALCCDDWRGQYVIGNVLELGIEGVWQHPRFEAARRVLYRGERAFLAPCAGCNVRTYRNGLLPDKFGKKEMPAPNDATMKLIGEAQRRPLVK